MKVVMKKKNSATASQFNSVISIEQTEDDYVLTLEDHTTRTYDLDNYFIYVSPEVTI